MAPVEIPRPSIVGNTADEIDMCISNVADPQALHLLARVLAEKATAARDKAEAAERDQ
jgi:hypothetical protein